MATACRRRISSVTRDLPSALCAYPSACETKREGAAAMSLRDATCLNTYAFDVMWIDRFCKAAHSDRQPSFPGPVLVSRARPCLLCRPRPATVVS